VPDKPSFNPAEYLAGLPTSPASIRFFNAGGRADLRRQGGRPEEARAVYFQKTHASPRTAMMVSQIAGARSR
jgi:hypothetical protein